MKMEIEINSAATAPSSTLDDDETLMQRVQSGDDHAFDVLIERHASRVYNFARRATGDPAAADDVFQDTFLRACQARMGWRRQSRFTTWLLTIARNRITDRFRWLGRWKTTSVEDESGAPRPELRTVQPGPEEAAVREEDRQELRKALLGLPMPQREVLILSRYEELSYAEIATMTGTTEEAIKQRAYRGMMELRRKLATPGASRKSRDEKAMR